MGSTNATSASSDSRRRSSSVVREGEVTDESVRPFSDCTVSVPSLGSVADVPTFMSGVTT